MKIIFQKNISKLRQRGLTLVEMMVATSLLVVMMLGLTAMFNQTQRAFRGGLKQVDVFEGGRAVMDLIARDIEQAVVSKSSENFSFVAGLPGFASSLTQNLLVSGNRTNVLYQCFLLNYSADWNAIGYRVLDQNNVNATGLAYGSLYRFTTNFSDFNTTFFNDAYYRFTNSPSLITNQSLTRIADGIVHFRLNFYDSAGRLIPPRDPDDHVLLLPRTNPTNVPPGVGIIFQPLGFPDDPTVIFTNTLPWMVEIELGILEPQILKQAQSLPTSAQLAYLQKQASKVHVFRQQIPIRNAPR